MSTPFQVAWARSVLAGIGAPATKANVDFLVHWQAAEGGPSDNPLNTTIGQPGAQGSSIRGYGSVAAGVKATVQTLLGGGYSTVVEALRGGSDEGTIGEAVLASPWDGNGHYAGTDFASWVKSLPASGVILSGKSPIPQGSLLNIPHDVTSLVGGAYNTGKTLGQGVTSVADAIGWLFGTPTQPGNWLRVLEFLGGVILGVFGLVLLGRAGREAG